MRSDSTHIPAYKRLALEAYYWSTLPYRRAVNAREQAQGRAPAIVLFYHRVANDLSVPWTVTPKMFERQITWLKSRFRMVSLGEVQQIVRSGENREPVVSITFDDGYADNCRHAIPLLIKQRVPCTYFVCTRNVTEGLPFPHDLKLGKKLQPNTVEELRWMAKAGIDIGAHTRNHVDMGALQDKQVMYDELITAGEELQSAVGSPVRYFAFPFGQHANLSASAIHIAYDHGYEAICSAYGGFNFPGDDAFHLQRIPVDNDMIRLMNWVTIDPRKRRTQRFQYGPGMQSTLKSRAKC